MSQRLKKEEIRRRSSELQALLNEWDFIGVMNDPTWPRDEYDCLIGPLLRRLESGETESQVAQFLEHELRHHFGMHRVEDLDEFAKRAKRWFDTNWPMPVV